jgi:hypothetical protein
MFRILFTKNMAIYEQKYESLSVSRVNAPLTAGVNEIFDSGPHTTSASTGLKNALAAVPVHRRVDQFVDTATRSSRVTRYHSQQLLPATLNSPYLLLGPL